MDLQTNISVKQHVAEVFGRTTATYDRVGPRMFSIFGDRLVERAKLCYGAQVLDAAAGRGAVLLPAARAVGPEGFVTGIDISARMVTSLCNEIVRCRLTNADVQVMDAEHLYFADHSFDAVLCGLSMFFFPHPHQALSEFHRVLQPCGKVAISVWADGDARWSWFGALAQEYSVALSGQADIQVNRPVSAHLNRPAEMRAALEQAGFHNVQVFVEETELIYANEEEWWAVQESHWVRNLLDWIATKGGPETLARFKAEAFQKMQPLRQANGFHQIVRVQCWVAEKTPTPCP